MLCQIGEHEDLLLRPEITRHLMAGYTLVYQSCVIFKQLLGDEAQKVDELARILAACPEDGAREHLLANARAASSATQPPRVARADSH